MLDFKPTSESLQMVERNLQANRDLHLHQFNIKNAGSAGKKVSYSIPSSFVHANTQSTCAFEIHGANGEKAS